MNYERGCEFYEPEQSSSEITLPPNEEGEEAPCYVIESIWRNKMTQSNLFPPSEVAEALHVWIEFMQKILKHNSNASAEELYISTATVCAQHLKHFSEYGWQCLLKKYPSLVLKCSRNSLEEQDIKNAPVPSKESPCDIHTQVEFLLQLVYSSNVNLHLARLALNKTFSPNFNYNKSPNEFRLPRRYWETDLECVSQEQIRTKLIYGDCDGYILPLQIASEVNEEFFTAECAEINCISKFTKDNVYKN